MNDHFGGVGVLAQLWPNEHSFWGHFVLREPSMLWQPALKSLALEDVRFADE